MKKIISLIMCSVIIISSVIIIIIDLPEASALPGDDELYIYSIDLLNNKHNSILDKQLDVDSVYSLIVKANSTSGWSDIEIEIKAWYDGGKIGMASNYPAELESHRNAAFTIIYHSGNGTAWVEFPAGDLEVRVISINDSISTTNSAHSEQSIHELEISFYIGPQMLATTGDNFIADGPEYSHDKALALDDPWSWDLEVTARDRNDHSVSNSSYGEFGTFIFTNISVYGTPEAYGQPGEDNIKMSGYSVVNYSANGVYYIDIQGPDLTRQGGGGTIPITNLAVRLMHPLANESNSEISSQPVHFSGTDIPLVIWGNTSQMLPVGNGTMSSGPARSNYNSPDNHSTYIEWWVDIPEGTPLGIYDWVATFTIAYDDPDNKFEYPLFVNGVHVEDHTPPISNVTGITELNDQLIITANGHDAHSNVRNLTLWHRYSEDNHTWGGWAPVSTLTLAQGIWTIDSEMGYYEFYTVAEDEGGNFQAQEGNVQTFHVEKDDSMIALMVIALIIVSILAGILIYAVKAH